MSEEQLSRPEFVAFPKIPRLNRAITITEKIDGTNAQVVVLHDGRVFAGSRTRFVTPESDNYGFAKWVKDNEKELADGLGPGIHYGEWWGSGIQRRYGLDHKRFSLFNEHRWGDNAVRPNCCGVVPKLYTGQFSQSAIQDALSTLRDNGSFAAPGFMQPEGIVVYMHASGTMHKVLLEGDELPKGVTTHLERKIAEEPHLACRANI